MDYRKVVEELREYRAELDAAIEAVERLQPDRPHRGRPPAWPHATKRPREGKLRTLREGTTGR